MSILKPKVTQTFIEMFCIQSKHKSTDLNTGNYKTERLDQYEHAEEMHRLIV